MASSGYPAFDTHAFVKRLTDADMPLRQAEILADEQSKSIESNLATKQDLAQLGDRLIVRFGAMLAAAVVIIAALGRWFS